MAATQVTTSAMKHFGPLELAPSPNQNEALRVMLGGAFTICGGSSWFSAIVGRATVIVCADRVRKGAFGLCLVCTKRARAVTYSYRLKPHVLYGKNETPMLKPCLWQRLKQSTYICADDDKLYYRSMQSFTRR